MADQTIINSGTPERVAFDLAVRIANAESVGRASLSRKAMLELYAQCLLATRGEVDAPSLT